VVYVGGGDHGFQGSGGVFGGEFDFLVGVSGHSWEMCKGGGRRVESGEEDKWMGCRERTGEMFLPDGLEVDFDTEAFSDAVEAT
jgi:hypothetical protein